MNAAALHRFDQVVMEGGSHLNHFNNNNNNSIPVIDPANRACTRVVIPLTQITETKGVSDYFRSKGRVRKDLSLCLLFQQGRCNLGVRCHQVHADRAYIAQVRLDAFRGVVNDCCAGHSGDNTLCTADAALHHRLQSCSITLLDAKHREHPLRPSQLARTDALVNRLESLADGDALTLHHLHVCKPHFERRCKHGRQCKNIHLCRDLATVLNGGVGDVALPNLAPSQPAAAPSRPAAPRPMFATTGDGGVIPTTSSTVTTSALPSRPRIPPPCSLPPLVTSSSPIPQPPQRPAIPPRLSGGSPTHCLRRFLRKWQQPDARSSCGSSTNSMMSLERCLPRDMLASQEDGFSGVGPS
eukprot:PhM_4_TR3479/c0_g1_i2/m.46280